MHIKRDEGIPSAPRGDPQRGDPAVIKIISKYEGRTPASGPKWLLILTIHQAVFAASAAVFAAFASGAVMGYLLTKII